MKKEQKNPITVDIVLDVQRGSIHAFEKIYEQYHKRIYFFALHHVSDQEIASDVVQNTFIAVHRHVAKLKHPEAFHVWIMRIAYNELINIVRKPKAETISLEQAKDVDAYIDKHRFVMPESGDDKMIYEVVSHKVNTLDAKFKDVATLKFLNGYSENEIASIMNIPLGTVKSRLRKVKTTLQKSLKEQGLTPQTYKARALAFTPLMYQTYAYMFETETANVNLHTNIAELMQSPIPKVAAAGISAWKITLAGSLCVAGGAAIWFAMPEDKPQVKEPVAIVEPSHIANVDYSDNYTNQPIEVRVETTNDNYDKILLNQREDLTIYENGNYEVHLMKDDKVVDSYSFEVNNIDIDLPEYQGYTLDGDVCTVYIKDLISGVDEAKIRYIKNGDPHLQFTYNKDTQTITFVYDNYSSNIFYVTDQAGNELKVSLESENYLKKSDPSV